MKKRRRRRMSILVPIATMGDIAFLLIIFFVLTSNFVKEAQLDLEEPRAPEVKEFEATVVSIKMDAEGTTYLQGDATTVEGLAGEVEALLAGSEEKEVMLTVHRALTKERYGPVIQELSKVGVTIGLVGEKLEDEER